MLDVIKDVVKSKTMVMLIIFIIGVSYIGTSQNQQMTNLSINNVEFNQQIN